MFPTSGSLTHCTLRAAALALFAALLAPLDGHAQAVASNVAQGKLVTVTTNGADDPNPGVGRSPADITDDRLDYQPASSNGEDGVVGYVNNDYNQQMTVTVTIDLGQEYDISAIRYNMGDVQFGDTWKPDTMTSPFGETNDIAPGGSFKGAWTTQTGQITASRVSITFTKTRRAQNEDWLFIGEIQIYGTLDRVSDQSEKEKAKVILLLHGMNSNPGTWQNFVDAYFSSNCPIIYNGKVQSDASRNPYGVFCYRIDFGFYDKEAPDLLGVLTAQQDLPGPSVKPIPEDTAGDFSTFAELGAEVNTAIKAIAEKHDNSVEIVLIGHSRGGLAARAFLQNTDFQLQHENVIGLLTIGTPHGGSQLGRIYDYLNDHPEAACRKGINSACAYDWDVMRFLIGDKPCEMFINKEHLLLDLRRPTIGFLANTSESIKSLNEPGSMQNLPRHISYGEMVYSGIPLGRLTDDPDYRYQVFPDVGVKCSQMSHEAQVYLIGAGIMSNDGELLGDGIVPAGQQSLISLDSLPNDLRVDTKTDYTGVLHTEEPKDIVNIDSRLKAMFGDWWTTE